jgi:hypothetical protein
LTDCPLSDVARVVASTFLLPPLITDGVLRQPKGRSDFLRSTILNGQKVWTNLAHRAHWKKRLKRTLHPTPCNPKEVRAGWNTLIQSLPDQLTRIFGASWP